MRQIVAAGLQQLRQWILYIERHQLVAQGVRRRMQRHSQSHRAVKAETLHHGHHTRGRDRHTAARKPIAVVVQHGFERRHQGCVILQGLAHAHHHHIGDDTLVQAAFMAQSALCKPKLCSDFCCAEVTAETLCASRAKRATHGTASLGRNAQGTSIGLRDEHRFDGVTLPHIEHPFDGAVR